MVSEAEDPTRQTLKKGIRLTTVGVFPIGKDRWFGVPIGPCECDRKQMEAKP